MINSTLYDLCGMYMCIDGCAYVARKICRCRNELFFSNASYMSDMINPPSQLIAMVFMHMGVLATQRNRCAWQLFIFNK